MCTLGWGASSMAPLDVSSDHTAVVVVGCCESRGGGRGACRIRCRIRGRTSRRFVVGPYSFRTCSTSSSTLCSLFYYPKIPAFSSCRPLEVGAGCGSRSLDIERQSPGFFSWRDIDRKREIMKENESDASTPERMQRNEHGVNARHSKESGSSEGRATGTSPRVVAAVLACCRIPSRAGAVSNNIQE